MTASPNDKDGGAETKNTMDQKYYIILGIGCFALGVLFAIKSVMIAPSEDGVSAESAPPLKGFAAEEERVKKNFRYGLERGAQIGGALVARGWEWGTPETAAEVVRMSAMADEMRWDDFQVALRTARERSPAAARRPSPDAGGEARPIVN